MNALHIVEPYRIRQIDLPMPVVGDGEILLQLCFVGFCGSDLNTFRGENPMAKPSVIPGHEIGAVIAAIGSGVPDCFHLGQTVTVNPYTHCGCCASCKVSRYNACEYNETLGVQRDGAMREYISIPWDKVLPVERISVRDAALIEPLSVGFHVVDRIGVDDADTVLVIGFGIVGLGAVVRSIRRGATVIVADISRRKLELASRLGAAYVYDTTEEWGALPVPDIVIEAAGTPATYRMALERVGFCGRVACVGYAKSNVELPTGLIVKKELEIKGSRNATPSDFRAVIRTLQEEIIPLDCLISEVIRPAQVQDALERWASKPGEVFRILVKWNTEN